MAPEPHPPDYVRRLDQTGIPGTETLDWLEFGLQHRTRFELHDDDYRQPELARDEQFVMQSLGYVGVRRILDPLRFGLEFQDARQFGSRFPEKDTDVNEADFLQAFAELYFEDALGPGMPFSLQAGRFTLDYADRHLVNRNRWQNAINTFDGFRLRLGELRAPFEVNAFAVQPFDRRLRSLDHGDDEAWFYGLIGAWRGWSEIITLEPYYFVLDEDRTDAESADREVHSVGLHGYGLVGTTGLDYDFSGVYQFGQDGDRRHRASAAYGELGYMFEHPWKPRLSASVTYASGDRDPDDALEERFEKLFVTAHRWSPLCLFTWQNVIGPKMRLTAHPHKKLRVDMAYGGYWLASDTDAWVMAKRRDPGGQSGDFVGQELDVRFVYRVDPRITIETGYAALLPGSFASNTGPADDSDFFYVQTTVQLFP